MRIMASRNTRAKDPTRATYSVLNEIVSGYRSATPHEIVAHPPKHVHVEPPNKGYARHIYTISSPEMVDTVWPVSSQMLQNRCGFRDRECSSSSKLE